MGELEITPKRGEVYLVNFDPTLGSEIQKIRPALIIQNDIANQYSRITIVAAITTANDGKMYPTEVRLVAGEGGLERNSVILLSQLRSIDVQRIVRKLGRLSEGRMVEVEQALLVSFGIER